MLENKYSAEATKILRSFYAKKRRITYPRGELLFDPTKKNKADRVLYIEQGRVIEYDFNEKGEKVILNILKEGAFFPMPYVLNKKDIDYYFEADDILVVRESSAKDVLTFLESNSVVMFDLMSRVSSGLDGVLKRLFYSLSGSLEDRIMAELCLSAERFGCDIDDFGNQVLRQSLTVTRISELVGASREATSRTIGQLMAGERIDRQGRTYIIKQVMSPGN